MTRGELTEEEALFRRALKAQERTLGPEHPHTVVSVVNLAACLDRIGNTENAEKLHRRALEAQIRKLGPEHPDVLRSQNNLAASLRRAGDPELAEPYARQSACATAGVLGEAHPLALHRRNNLAITPLMLGRTADTRLLLAQNWAPCPHRAIVTTAIAFLAAVAALLDGTAITDPIGRLKVLLLGPALEPAPGVAHPWDVGYMLENLREALPADSGEFLQALLAAINDPTEAPTLDRFPLWRDTPAVALDTPGPKALKALQPEPANPSPALCP
jgi:hypothetical protein